MPRVVDTSVALKWVVREDFTDNALALRDDSLRNNSPIYVPPLLMYEATNVLYDFARQQKFTELQAEQAVADIAAIVTIVPFDTPQPDSAMRLANRANKQDTYDSQFLAFALSVDCELWTADRRYERAVRTRIFGQRPPPIHLIETFSR